MEQVKITITGTSPLLMHSDRLSNPLDPLTKEIKTYTGKRKKTDEDHLEIARLEWRGGMYYDPKIGPYIPARNIKAALIVAAKKSKDGPKMKTGATILESMCPLKYRGPRDIEKLWEDGNFADIRSVAVMSARTMRCRPVFTEWETTFTAVYDAAVVDKVDIVRFAETAGQLVGIGDYRPANGGDFGRFEVKEAK